MGPTCLLCPCLHGGTAGPVPRGVEGGHADPVRGVARQVLQLHPSLGQEKGLDSSALVLALLLPEVDLQDGVWGEGSGTDPTQPTFPEPLAGLQNPCPGS